MTNDVWGGGISSWSEGGSFSSPSPVSSNTGGDAQVPAGDVKKQNTEVGRSKDLLLLQNLPTSRNFHNSLSSCCYSLLVRVSVFRHPGVSLSEAKPFSRHWNHHGPSLILEAQVPQFSKGTSEFQEDSRASAASSQSLRNMIVRSCDAALNQIDTASLKITYCPYFVKRGQPPNCQFYRKSKKMAPFYILQMLREVGYPPSIFVSFEDKR